MLTIYENRTVYREKNITHLLAEETSFLSFAKEFRKSRNDAAICFVNREINLLLQI